MQCWSAWSTLPTSILAPNTQCWTLVRIGKRENPKAPDHHLTTPSSQPVLFVIFSAPTFFYNHHKQRRKLCTLHTFRRWFIVFSCLSRLFNFKGQRFESPPAAPGAVPLGAALIVCGRIRKRCPVKKDSASVKLFYWAQFVTASRKNCAQPGTLRS